MECKSLDAAEDGQTYGDHTVSELSGIVLYFNFASRCPDKRYTVRILSRFTKPVSY